MSVREPEEREPDWDDAASALDDQVFEESQSQWAGDAESDFDFELAAATDPKAKAIGDGPKVKWTPAGPMDLKDPYNHKKRGSR